MPPRKTTKSVTAPKAAKATKTSAVESTPLAPAAAPAIKSEVKGSGTAAKAAPAPRTLTHEQIAKRAFEIYASRGYAPGDPAADWLEAERQLKAGL